ncbi:MAG: glutaredoxin 3 [Deltaproteobacteria bacterium]|jgi:glutaredoxin 3|nr:glutaredoxin 3 [Deltaproteobacteria bacterium]
MKPVTVYTTNWCPYCVRAKKLLGDRGIPFTEVDVEGDDEKRAWLVRTTGQRTVPQIFIGEESVGGFSELRELDVAGDLMPKVQGL